VLTLPIRNVTVEELSYWFCEQMWVAPELEAQGLHYLKVRVSSGPGQWAAAERARD
jgi:hypothetical protein